jgi:pimeloyl-ACP methyl ester carboxylesterase
LGAVPRERVVAVGGVELLVREWGAPSATPIVFWHGLAADGSGLAARPLADALGGAAYLVAPDAPGFGGSPRLAPEGYRGAALAIIVTGLLDTLETERCAFVGESWGAWVGCNAVAAVPDRVSPLVLLDGGYTEPVDWGARAMRRTRLADCVEIGRSRGAPDPKAWGAAFYATLQPPHVSGTYGAIAAARVPVLLLASGADRDPASESGLERFRSLLPAAEVRVLAGVGHDVLTEQAAARSVADWLVSQPGA